MSNPTGPAPSGDVKPRGPALRLFSTIPVVLTGIALLSLLVTAKWLNVAQAELAASEKRYVSAQVSANELKNASDDMTTTARLFALSGDEKYLRQYFDDSVLNSRRERAVEALEDRLSDSSALSTLHVALDYSNKLMEREYTAMSLVVVAQNIPESKYTAYVGSQLLTDQQAALSPDEQMALARDLLLDGDYQFYDGMIDTNVNNCIGFLAKEQNQTEKDLTARIQRLIIVQQLFLVLLAAMIAVIAALNFFFVLRPLNRAVEQIKELEDLPMQGVFEVQYLAMAYNLMLAENRRHNDQLTYEAQHDALTGLYNRGAFDKLRVDLFRRPCALIHVDVDLFKHINDNYGHSKGDQALQKVANALHLCFRRSDYPFRTGGDEFAVIMTGMTGQQRDVVYRKLCQVSARLQDTSDGLPPITLSVGVAFQDSPCTTGDLYKDADAALYIVKEHGRNGIAFYDGPETVMRRYELPSGEQTGGIL